MLTRDTSSEEAEGQCKCGFFLPSGREGVGAMVGREGKLSHRHLQTFPLRLPQAWPVIMTGNVVIVEVQKLIWGGPIGYLLK